MTDTKECPVNWTEGNKIQCDEHACQYWDTFTNKCSIDSEEIWKDVDGYEGRFQISSQGRARAIEDRLTVDTMTSVKVYRLLNQVEMNQDYLGVHYDGKGFFVHVLVAKAFHPNTEGKRLVVHKNRKKYDNRADNIIWQTNSECVKAAIESGRMGKPPGYRGYIIECIETGEIFYGLQSTAEKLNCKVADLENSVYKGQEIDGLNYRILHNYALQKITRPDIFTEPENLPEDTN